MDEPVEETDVEEGHVPHNGDRRFIVFLLVTLCVLTLVLNIQSFQRRDALDKTLDSTVRTEEAVDEINTATQRIKVIAEDVATDLGDPQQTAQVEALFFKIDAIYQAVVPDASG